METPPPFDLNALKRDWIDGISGDAFFQLVEWRIEQIRKSEMSAHFRGVMLLEADPIQFMAAFFAAIALRAPVILANRNWGRTEWEAVSDMVNPSIICGHAPVLNREKRSGIEHPHSSTILIPTGGSSGEVKFAVHKWETLLAACEGLSAFIGPGPMNFCCVLPLYHVSGLMQVVRAFVTGGRIAFPEFKALQAGKFPDFKAGTLCLSLVPTQLQRLLMKGEPIVDQLMASRVIFVGGAAITEAVADQARELKLPIVLSYGMTETAAMVTALSPDEFLGGNMSAGRPLNHAQIKVVGDGGAVCSIGETGRIQVGGGSLCNGCHGDTKRMARGGYLTGDEGYFDSLGRLHVVGRCDRVIISGGEKIDPKEVESAILNAGGVDQVLVVGVPDAEWGHRVIAFYVSSTLGDDRREWEQELRVELTYYKLPKLVIQVAKLPLNAHGKVDHDLIQEEMAQYFLSA